jgi:hypothetical protein
VPAEHRVGLDKLGHCLQGRLAELLAEIGQGLALAITQQDASFDLMAQYPVFCHQRLMAHQEFLIDGPRDLRQQAFPTHRLPPSAFAVPLDTEYG